MCVVPRIQFHAIEIARNREGWNDSIKSEKSQTTTTTTTAAQAQTGAVAGSASVTKTDAKESAKDSSEVKHEDKGSATPATAVSAAPGAQTALATVSGSSA